MIRKTINTLILLTLLFAPLSNVLAQSSSSDSTQIISFDPSTVPQWAKDIRRVDIITFGTFPFSMFLSTFVYEMFRWNNQNGLDFSEAGRRYAPWPFKSAGAYDLTAGDYGNIVLIAAGLSLSLAITDLVITLIKRDREKRRVQSIPSGSYEIETRPYVDIEANEPPRDR